MSDSNTDMTLGMLVGVVLAIFGCYLFIVAGDMDEHHKIMTRHPEGEEVFENMRDECEKTRGVVECEWDQGELDYLPKDN